MRPLALFVLILLCLPALALSWPDFHSPGYANDPPDYDNCHNCHSSYPVNSGDGETEFNVPTSYTPGETYELALQISDDGQDRWGFQLILLSPTVDAAGTIIVTQPDYTQLSGGGAYLSQTSAGTFNNSDQGNWEFEWIAPAEGTGDVTLYYSLLACNGTGGTSGDYTYVGEIVITEADLAPYSFSAASDSPFIPAAGGTLNYTVTLTTQLPDAYPGVTYWTRVTLPNGESVGPLLYVTTTIPAYADVSVALTQDVPGFAPSGMYMHKSFLGYYPNPLLMTEFPFTKTLDGPAGTGPDTWNAHLQGRLDR